MSKISKLAGIFVLISALSCGGCASINNGQHQAVAINTGPVTGATCTLENNKGVWYVPSTPGRVVINRSYEDLQVVCNKPGFVRASKAVKSKSETASLGNILLPSAVGFIGSAVDLATGSGYGYPRVIEIPIVRG